MKPNEKSLMVTSRYPLMAVGNLLKTLCAGFIIILVSSTYILRSKNIERTLSGKENLSSTMKYFSSAMRNVSSS